MKDEIVKKIVNELLSMSYTKIGRAWCSNPKGYKSEIMIVLEHEFIHISRTWGFDFKSENFSYNEWDKAKEFIGL